MIKIINKSSNLKIPMRDLKNGATFRISEFYYLVTEKIDTENGYRTCVNLLNGEIEDYSLSLEVSPVDFECEVK